MLATRPYFTVTQRNCIRKIQSASALVASINSPNLVTNLNALNFLLHGALDGGGTLSLKTDAQGKVFSTALLRMVIDVPDAEARRLALPAAK